MGPPVHAMTPHVGLLTELALIMCVAAVTTTVFQRLHQPVVLGYLLAGLLVGPHLPLPLFADEAVARDLSELGVILLMFSLGLEFSLRKLLRVAPTAGVVAVIECSLMIWLGYLTGRAFGWTGYESLFAGSAIAISSTTIIVKAFGEQKVAPTLTEIVLGVLIVEDLIAILLMTVLTAVGSGARLEAKALALMLGKLAGFLAVLLAGGMLVVPRLMRAVVRLHRPETTVVASVGLCFAFALLARRFGYSVALGAFLAGALVAESGAGKLVEHRIESVRDVFAAVFFVSVGMLIDPVLVWQHAGAVVALTLVVILGKLVGVSVGAFVAGYGVRTSVQASLSLGQIGEFSFIIAAVGLSLGVTGSFLYPVAVAVSALTTLLTPFMIRASGRVASAVDRHLPHALQTYAALYGGWLQGLRATREHQTAWSRVRRLVGLLFLDAGLVAGIVIAASRSTPALGRWVQRTTPLPPRAWTLVVVIATLALLAPFLLGAIRIARALGVVLAAEALPAPPGGGGLDLAAAPRRALLVTLQIAVLMVAGVPVVAITQPFIPAVEGMGVLLAALALLVVPLWRSAANLQGHVRAGAQVILDALAAQSAAAPAADPTRPPETELGKLSGLPGLLPGLGSARTVRLGPTSPAVGRTLGELDLRGQTGATVIAIDREAGDVVYPTAAETLKAGDTLIVTGTEPAVEAAKTLLGG
jgi:CPA2 family monovalent cation:H+ antiporter-2